MTRNDGPDDTGSDDISQQEGPGSPGAESDAAQEQVKVVARLLDPDGFGSETPWATVTETLSGAEIVARVDNHCWFAGLVSGDEVRCRLDGDSRWQVVAVTTSQPRYAFLVLFTEDATNFEQRRAALCQSVITAGGEVEFAQPTLCVLVCTAENVDGVAPLLEAAEADGLISAIECVRTPDEPGHAETLDLTLVTEPTIEQHTSTYWAPEDPYWAEHDLDAPEFLAYVQHLVGIDARVAKACESGRQDQVVTFIERLSASAQGEKLPPLDGPIFTE